MTDMHDAVTERLERWLQKKPELEKLMWKDPVLVAGCLTDEYTLDIEKEVLEFFSQHRAVKNLPQERKELLARTLAEKTGVPMEIIRMALGEGNGCTTEQYAEPNSAVPLTSDLVLKIADLINRHIFFKDKRLPLLIGTWALGTYVYDIFTFYGYLWVNSPVKRCGKSLLEDILSWVCCRATPRLSNVTEAAIFRLADKGQTLILDELERLRGEDKEKYGAVMSILNAGFQAGGKVPRVEKVKGAGFETIYFNAFSPKVLAGINRLADTIEDRAFKVSMVRKTTEEKVQRFNLRKQSKDLATLREELALWAEAQSPDIETIYDGIEEIGQLATVDDRFKDISEPLIAIASFADAENSNGQRKILPDLIALLLDLAGKRGESERQEAIAAFVPLAEEIVASGEKVFIPSGELLEKAKQNEELAWIGSTTSLGNFLRKFDLFPKRDPKGKVRGYAITREWLEEMKNRYIALHPDSNPSDMSETRTSCGLEHDF